MKKTPTKLLNVTPGWGRSLPTSRDKVTQFKQGTFKIVWVNVTWLDLGQLPTDTSHARGKQLGDRMKPAPEPGLCGRQNGGQIAKEPEPVLRNLA